MFVEKGQIIQIKGPSKLSEVVASSCFNMWERNLFFKQDLAFLCI